VGVIAVVALRVKRLYITRPPTEGADFRELADGIVALARRRGFHLLVLAPDLQPDFRLMVRWKAESAGLGVVEKKSLNTTFGR